MILLPRSPRHARRRSRCLNKPFCANEPRLLSSPRRSSGRCWEKRADLHRGRLKFPRCCCCSAALSLAVAVLWLCWCYVALFSVLLLLCCDSLALLLLCYISVALLLCFCSVAVSCCSVSNLLLLCCSVTYLSVFCCYSGVAVEATSSQSKGERRFTAKHTNTNTLRTDFFSSLFFLHSVLDYAFPADSLNGCGRVWLAESFRSA